MVNSVQINMRIVMLGLGLLLLIATPTYILAAPSNDEHTTTSTVEWLQEFWIFRLFLNLIGYATILVPGYLIIKYVRSSNWLDRAGPGFVSRAVKLCVYGNPEEKESVVEQGGAPVTPTPKPEPTFMETCLKLLWCAFGLLGCYLIWGVIQERIMAFKYGATDTDPGENFKNSQFLVFVNRILAFTVAASYLFYKKQPRHLAPMYKYSYSSFSNIMSSWFQYESLKFVSFPTQVLAKSCKVIPVMIMGRFVSNKTFQLYEYVTALMISLGVGIFMLTSGDSVKDDSTSTTFSGLIILAGYLLFDAFTSNWQGELFTQYKMSSVQMMAGVNFFSIIFTSVSLFEQGGFIESAAFMLKYPDFVFHCVILSICSAFGQLFIFYTIGQFGAVVFTIIMTLRQGFAILLSCIIYNHTVTLWGVLGILTVFTAIFLKIYIGRMMKKKSAPSVVPSVEKTLIPSDNLRLT